MSSNLPPGITDGMLPGNRPEDEELERAAVAFDDTVSDLVLTAEEYNFFRRFLPALVHVRRELLKG